MAERERGSVSPGESTRDEFSWRKLAAFMGPGFLVSIAYIDPGNFLVDIQAGVRAEYSLLWVLALSSLLGLLLQVLCVRLGLVTGVHLARLCRDEYGAGSRMNTALWLFAELAIICSDIPEVIGSAFGLNMLWGVPLPLGVLITSVATVALLGVLYFGIRKLEGLIGAMVAVMGVCFVAEAAMSPIALTGGACESAAAWCGHFAEEGDDDECPEQYCGGLLGGLVLPRVDAGGIEVAVGIIGAVVMPHNLFLHSGIVLSREVNRRSALDVKWAVRYSTIECAAGLLVSCVINVAVVAVAAAVFFPNAGNGWQRVAAATDVGFDDADALLANALGGTAATLFGVALLASGVSSTITGTYAGQFVMDGFLDLQMTPWKRNLLTRAVAIGPSLLVAALAGKRGANALIVICSIVLSFQLPFTLVPLLRFTASPGVMGDKASSRGYTLLCAALAVVVVLANMYLVYSSLSGWWLWAAVLFGVLYLWAIAHLMFRRLSLSAGGGGGGGGPAQVEMAGLLASPGSGEDSDSSLDSLPE